MEIQVGVTEGAGRWGQDSGAWDKVRTDIQAESTEQR